MTIGQRICAGLVGVELAILGWCAYAIVNVYRSVKGKTG